MTRSCPPHQGLFPIQRLHPEILAEIFTFCLSDDQTGAHDAPVLLCNICSSWRALAIATPRLWTNLTLRYTSVTNLDIQSVVDRVDSWLGRSGCLPLNIYFSFYPSMEQAAEAFRVCKALSKHASRWETLVVSTSIPFASWPKLSSVPLLRTLCVQTPFSGVPFAEAPCLADVTFALELNAFSTVASSIPWHQLKRINLFPRIQTCHEIMELITCCPLLESLRVRVGGPHLLDAPAYNGRIEHVALRNIEIIFVHNCRVLLDTLVLPALASISISVGAGGHSANISRFSGLTGLLDRSRCKLEKLTLGNCGFAQDQVIEFLKHKSCRTLTSLHIVNTSWHLPKMLNGELLLQPRTREELSSVLISLI